MSNNLTTGKSLTLPIILAGALLMSAMLSACDTLNEMTINQEPPPCPQVSTLGEAASVTRFVEGPGRDLIDIDFTAKIVKLSGKCVYEYDSDTGEGIVRVELSPKFRIERGAANRTRTADFTYFISILDDTGAIMDKQLLSYSGKYWKNKDVISDTDRGIEVSIPFNSEQYGEDFSVYVGFQLSEEELQYNRGLIRH